MIAGIETGGTKVVCAVAERGGGILHRTTIPTSHPEETVGQIVEFLRDTVPGDDLEAIGLGTFGPVDLDPQSPQHGVLGRTPKARWTGVRIKDLLHTALAVPVAIDTDVNASALAEVRWGAAQGLDPVVYVTVGTGVGVGGVVGGHTLQGYGGGHPVLGHLLVRRHPRDTFAGHCSFHADCLEGLAAGPALEQRWGRHGVRAPELDPLIADLAGYYLAQLVVAITYGLMPGCVVLGGGISAVPGLRERTREHSARLVAGYLDDHPLSQVGSDYIRPPALDGQAGVLGALAMADDLLASTPASADERSGAQARSSG
ncbi:MAG: ROK family protein [Actinobacteria bacterium]|nr:ROK family protein [Actinomycetota bacterium]